MEKMPRQMLNRWAGEFADIHPSNGEDSPSIEYAVPRGLVADADAALPHHRRGRQTMPYFRRRPVTEAV